MASLRTPGGPRHVVYSGRGYALRRGAGLALAGATEEEAGYEDRTTAAGVARVLADWCRLFPARADAPLAAVWSGLRPATPDALPLIGPYRDDAVWVATGHFRNGILLAPGTAEMCAAGLLENAAPPSAFAPERFGDEGSGARANETPRPAAPTVE
jgi:glycine oxidase